MPQKNEQDLDQDLENNQDDTTETKVVALPTTPEELEALLEARTAERLQGVKKNLDEAYKARDKAQQLADELKRKEQAAEIKALEEQGKHREAYELQMKQLREENEALAAKNVTLSRDNLLTTELAAMPFRNAKAHDMALQEIKAELIRDESGQWVHKSGVSIKDAVTAFGENEANAFLFKQKPSSGAGLTTPKPLRDKPTDKKLSSMSQDDVLKLAAEGKLPNQRR